MHRIIHVDLQSANVILTNDPHGAMRVVITHFGLARSALNPAVSGGSPGYMAPELYAGAPTTVASDIYALGVILHELASGFRPHLLRRHAGQHSHPTPADSPANSYLQRLTALSHAPLPPLHSRWDPILKCCLQADPTRRYDTVYQVFNALGPSVARRRLLIFAVRSHWPASGGSHLLAVHRA